MSIVSGTALAAGTARPKNRWLAPFRSPVSRPLRSRRTSRGSQSGGRLGGRTRLRRAPRNQREDELRLCGTQAGGHRRENIPWCSSPVLFNWLNDEIIKLKDEGRVLMRFNKLRETLTLRMSGISFQLAVSETSSRFQSNPTRSLILRVCESRRDRMRSPGA